MGDIVLHVLIVTIADGDGDFHPNAKVKTDKPIRELTKEQKEKAFKYENGIYKFDRDKVAWLLYKDKKEK